MLNNLVLALRASRKSQLQLSRGLVTQPVVQLAAEAAVQEGSGPQPSGPRDAAPDAFRGGSRPAWWSDSRINAAGAYRIVKKRIHLHGSQREENYRQIICRVKNPKDAALALDIVRRGRAERAVLEQHVPFTFHTSQQLLNTCNEVKAFDTALECLEQANELGLQFFRGDVYYSTMKAAALDGRLDIAVKVFEAMKQNGVRPGGKVVHNLIMGSIINGRKDLAESYAEEFRLNGVKINTAAQEWLDGVRTPNLNSNPTSINIDADQAASQQAADPQATSASAVTSA